MRVGQFASLSFVPSPEDRQPLTPAGFVRGALLAYICYYAMAVLVILPNTRHYRIYLLPIGSYLAFRAATMYDYSGGDPAQKFQNFGQCVSFMLWFILWLLLKLTHLTAKHVYDRDAPHMVVVAAPTS